MKLEVSRINKDTTTIRTIIPENDLDVDNYFEKIKDINEEMIIDENKNFMMEEFTMVNSQGDLVNMKKVNIGEEENQINTLICNIILETDIDITTRLKKIVKTIFPKKVINKEEKIENLALN